LVDGGESGYVEIELPAKQDQKEPTIGKGKLAWRLYVAPEGKTAIEVMRNYEAALAKAGFAAQVTCVPGNCKMRNYTQFDHWLRTAAAAAPAKRLRYSYTPQTPMQVAEFFTNAPAERKAGILSTRVQGGAKTFVSITVGEQPAPGSAMLPDKSKLVDLGQRTWFVAEVLEEAAVETGKVEVSNSEAIRSGLAEEGKKAIYGIYFDTGKAEVKPESRAQLTEIAALLAKDAKLNLFVVGHTDSAGTLEANIDLSRRRAAAVVAALTGEFKIAAARLTAQGLGPLAPVASNATEAGKAMNRRVELVVR
jgi:outer membrane protein OmpA-like peptidoglycan-associated protein